MKSGALRVGFEGRGSEDGIEQDRSVGKCGVNFAPGADAVANGHQNIENHEIGLEFRGFLDSGATIGSFTANFPVVTGPSK